MELISTTWNKRKTVSSLNNKSFHENPCPVHIHYPTGFGTYLGSDSTGFEIKYPFNPAAFSPCLPNPNPANLPCVLSAPVLPSLLILLAGLWVDAVPPVYRFEMKEGGPEVTIGRTSMPATWVGKALLACSRQEVTERLDLADSRNISPRRTLTHPREKRKKAETRVKVSTWCERIAAPILDGYTLRESRKVIWIKY